MRCWYGRAAHGGIDSTYCQKSTDKARVLGYKDLKFQPTPEQTVKALDLLLIIITQCIKYII